MEQKKIFIVDHESIRGPEIHKAFLDESLAKKFTETIGCGGIRELEILDTIPDSFMFFVMFDNGEVLDSGLWTNDKLRNCIAVYTPTRISIIVDAPDKASAVDIARKRAVDFIRSASTLNMDVTYSLSDGSVTLNSDLKTPMPMIKSMRDQAIALLEGRTEDALIHSVETVLLFWASPSSINHLYRFDVVEGSEDDKRLDITIPAGTSKRNIEIRRADKDEFLSIAERLGFEQVESNNPNLICLKRN